jgi:hypothetical protein
MRAFWLVSLAFAYIISFPARAEDAPIGFVKTLSGTVSVTHGGASTPAALGTAVYENDWIQTSTDGEIGVTFRDNTRISLGPDSRVQFTHFVFKPASEQYGFLLRLAHGTLEYISGLTTKLAPDAMSVETPGFTVGARGTRFLVRTEH